MPKKSIFKSDQLISRERVVNYAEVFTSEREVNAMLDLVKHETENIDSRFLEPACGTGNFLIEVLRRKLSVVERRYGKSQLEFERASFTAISSLYGIDLLQDNVEQCSNRLFQYFDQVYKRLFGDKIKNDFLNSIKFVLSKNMIRGNALTLMKVGLTEEPLVFSEWSLTMGNLVQRRDFKMEHLLKNQKMDVPNLFSDLGDEAFIPVPVKTFELQNIFNLTENVQYEL